MESLCNFCTKNSTMCCSACKVSNYCDINCQKKDWIIKHKDVCSLLGITRELIQQRKTEFLKNVPKSANLPFNLDSYDQILNQLSKFEKQYVHFFSNFMIAATRILEVYSLDQNGKPIYNNWYSRDFSEIEDLMVKDFGNLKISLQFYLEGNLVINKVSKEDKRIIEAKRNILNHLDAIKLVLNQIDINESQIEDFYNSIEFYEFSKIINMYGLSCFDGRVIYIRQNTSHKTIEHEFAHSISRFFDQIKDPRKISPSKNSFLKINNQMVEAGDFYEYKVYNYVPLVISPFCLTGAQYRCIY